jgi:hypothetical protein
MLVTGTPFEAHEVLAAVGRNVTAPRPNGTDPFGVGRGTRFRVAASRVRRDAP